MVEWRIHIRCLGTVTGFSSENESGFWSVKERCVRVFSTPSCSCVGEFVAKPAIYLVLCRHRCYSKLLQVHMVYFFI